MDYSYGSRDYEDETPVRDTGRSARLSSLASMHAAKKKAELDNLCKEHCAKMKNVEKPKMSFFGLVFRLAFNKL